MDIITKTIEKAVEVESKKSKEEIEKLVEELQKQAISPTATALSSATTVAEQREAGLRKVRSDLGSKRGP